MKGNRCVLFEEMIRSFLENEIKPLAEQYGNQENFSNEIKQKMEKIGLFGLVIPPEYGGTGATQREYIYALEEISKHCATAGMILSAHTSLCAMSILENGTEEQKKRFLPDLASGQKLGTFGSSELNVEVDADKQQIAGAEMEDHYLLNGSKRFNTNVDGAEVFLIIAATDMLSNGSETTAFLVEKGMPGIRVRCCGEEMDIQDNEAYELIFENVKVPKENVLGMRGDGLKIAKEMTESGRIGSAALAVGIAKGTLDTIVAYVKQRKLFGRTLSNFQNTRFQLADMATKIAAARALVYIAADAKQNKLPGRSVNAAQAKLLAAEAAVDVATKAVQIYRGCGDMCNDSIERILRDAEIMELYVGTVKRTRMVISDALMRESDV